MKVELWIVGGLTPMGLLLLAVTNVVSFDAAIGSIQFLLGIPPVILVWSNYRTKSAQDKAAMVTLGSGLLCIAAMFVILGFAFSASMTALSGLLWSLVAVQAFLYGRKEAP